MNGKLLNNEGEQTAWINLKSTILKKKKKSTILSEKSQAQKGTNI